MHEKIIEALTSAHRTMKHVLTLVRVQVDMLHPEAERTQFEFLHNAIGYMHNYPGLVHHPTEELIFERLVRFAPQTGPLCARLIEQHKTFKEQEAAMLSHIRSAQSGDGAACGRIREIGVAYCDAHADHIDGEESEALPRALDCLLVADWREIGAKSHFETDPLGDPKTLARYGSLYDYIMAASVNFSRH